MHGTIALKGLGCPCSSSRQLQLESSIDELHGGAWDALVRDQDLYFQRRYLRGVQRGGPAEVQHRYALFSQDGQPVGVACFQVVRFVGPSVDPLLQDSPLARWVVRAAGLDDGPLSLPVIVCGSTFNCGETGFHFAPQVSAQQALRHLAGALRRIRREQRASGALFKEFVPSSGPLAGNLPRAGYTELPTGGRMVLTLDPGWASFDDYLGSLKSKFRVKARRAYAKSRTLHVRPLDTAELQLYRVRMERLYAGVLDKAGYSLGRVGMGSLVQLRASLDSEMVVWGYFLHQELVGFMTAFQVGDSLDAHLVGFDYNENHAHSIYPRMLYDYLQIAIERGLSRVNYGRTAEQIKSTLGAEPVPTRCYLRHDNPLLNPFLGMITRSISSAEPALRQPFKAAVVAERRAA